jgi:membrane fusion protein, multidrug efflux system
MRRPLSALIAGLGLLGACRSTPAREARPAGPVRPIEAVRAGIRRTASPYRAAGTVQALTRADLATRMMARVETITVRVGDRVRAGQVLATFERGAVTAAGNQASAGLDLATTNLRRMERLYADSAVPIAQLEAARAARQQAEGQAGAVTAELRYASLVAPFSGTITARNADPGALAAPGQTILVLQGDTGREIVVGVPETIAAGLATGRPISVLVGTDERPILTRIAAVVRAADPISHTVTVRLATDLHLTTNVAAVALFTAPDGGDSNLVVPRTAVVERGELTGVYLFQADSTVRLRWVRFGRSEGGDREVLSGLMAGDLVVRQATLVKDGDRARPVGPLEVTR